VIINDEMIKSKCNWWHESDNPERFMQISDRILPSLSIITISFLLAGLTLIWWAPEDYQQGLTVKIMFLHVPFAWLSLLCYTLMTLFSIGTLFWRHRLASIALKSTPPIGIAFTLLTLVTGALWGKPVWGTWWEWDARLTFMFILLLSYLGIFSIFQFFENAAVSVYFAAILTIVGFINIPIIQFSVKWWNTLHQPASILILGKGAPAIDSSILIPLLVMTMAFALVCFIFHLMAMRNEILRSQVIIRQRKRAQQSKKERP